MFETKSILDRNVFDKYVAEEMKNPKLRIKRFILWFAITALLSTLYWFLKVNVWIWLIVIAFLTVVFVRTIKKNMQKVVDNVLKPHKELTGKDCISYITRIEDDGIYIQNMDSNANGTIKFSDISKVREICGFYMFAVNSGAIIPINKNALSLAERKECIDLLKNKMPNLKWKNIIE